MKYPCVVLKGACKVPYSLKIKGEPNEDGDINYIGSIKGLCNYQECAVTRLTSDKTEVVVTGKAYMIGDICPSVPVISGGTLNILGGEREIHRGTKARNPDGTVNYTLIEVI